MIDRVLNALRKKKIATDENKDIYSRANRRYIDTLPVSDISGIVDYFNTPKLFDADYLLKNVRKRQATNNASALFPFGTKDYYNLRNHLINYGRAKQHNFNNPDNPVPLQRAKPRRLKKEQRDLIRRMEDLQVNNNPGKRYSNIG